MLSFLIKTLLPEKPKDPPPEMVRAAEKAIETMTPEEAFRALAGELTDESRKH